MKKIVIIGLLSLVVLSCKEQKEKNSQAAAAKNEKIAPEVKLYTFSGGTVMVNNLELFSQDTTYQGQSKEFADAFYVISHPDGNLMWDAGLPEALAAMDEPFTSPDGNFTVSRKDSVKNQLKSIDLSIEDIKYLAVSHTHFDHTGHANVFKDATWLVQGAEYDFITSEESQQNNADNYNAIKELTKVKKLNGDFDVFGDGSVIIKSMPGHTPGHQVLYLDLAEHGPLLLTGDLYHLYENREFKRVPIFNFDVAQTLASMDAFEAFAKEKNAKVYLQHQKEDFDKMPKAPKFLK
ncbi:N-acyl homoserine lactonase family protein [Muriicola sp. Z0-33]|uniref:N-acyl homoserine lactonase family protein n=1 Tax=Muriicola sp. Z0-33 TaxID=2816957 RepID=UPI002237DCB4|nr:N-acyl homoserine lactonase family protein [Muriicola sp. Z0-33]MCW5516330.1 N-acyl homoserine lactonase family protein [Muriicola sp. Z0-33]